MNQRSKEILYLLLERHHSSLQDLSDIHEVSERTIRNDITSLNDYLQNLQVGKIAIRQKQVVLDLEVDKQRLYDDLNRFNVYEYRFSSEERSLICLLILIGKKGYVTLNQLSEKLLASRSTIVNDVKVMRKLAEEHQLTVHSRTNKGYQVKAKEEDIRQFLYHIISQENFAILESVIFEDGYQEVIGISDLQNTLEKNRETIGLPEKQLNRMLRYLMISSYRNWKGFTLQETALPSDTDFARFSKWYVPERYPYLNENDLAYVYRQVMEDTERQSLDKAINKETLRLQVTAMQFIEAISAELDLDFKEDYIFYENFSAHLVRMMRKEEHRENKFLDISHVIASNPTIKRVILKYLPIIEKNIGRKATTLETDYIIIHVYAAMERKKRIGSNLKVAVLTEEKATEVLFIESKLVRNFSFNLDIYSIDDTIRGEYDLILTTTPLPNKNYVQISPFISDEDYILIASHVNRIVNEKEFHNFTLNRSVAAKLYQLIAEEIDQEPVDKQVLKSRIKERIYAYSEPDTEELREQALYEFLTPDRIELNVSAATWQESIYKAGQKLIERGDIDAAYLDEVIENINEKGPYVVISEGFAFPHAQLGDYNKTTSMSLIRLETPVYFDDEEHDVPDDITTMPVRYVCILSTTDRTKHLKAIFNLFNLLKDAAFKQALDACQTAEEIHQLIEEQERLLELRR